MDNNKLHELFELYSVGIGLGYTVWVSHKYGRKFREESMFKLSGPDFEDESILGRRVGRPGQVGRITVVKMRHVETITISSADRSVVVEIEKGFKPYYR